MVKGEEPSVKPEDAVDQAATKDVKDLKCELKKNEPETKKDETETNNTNSEAASDKETSETCKNEPETDKGSENSSKEVKAASEKIESKSEKALVLPNEETNGSADAEMKVEEKKQKSGSTDSEKKEETNESTETATKTEEKEKSNESTDAEKKVEEKQTSGSADTETKVEKEKEANGSADVEMKVEEDKKKNGSSDGETQAEEKFHESPTKNEAYVLLAQGKRHLLVKDYTSAVATLGDCCAKFSKIFGEMADECGDVYFTYGKALLELAREESEVLGAAMDKEERGIGSEEEVEDEDETEDEDYESIKKAIKEKIKENAEGKSTKEDTEEKKDKDTEEKKGKDTEEKKEEDTEKKKEEDTEKKKEEDAEEKKEAEMKCVENEIEAEVKKENGLEKDETKKAGDGERAEADEDEEEDDVNNLQLAWEMLELAKVIYERQKLNEKVADAFLKLGEVSLETENYEQAIEDMTKSLELQEQSLNKDNRGIAETQFQLGIACSLANFHEKSVEYFKKSQNVLKERVKNLLARTEPEELSKKNAFYNIDDEIKEIQAIIPEIDEKIADLQDLRKQTLRVISSSLGLNKAKEGESSSSVSSESNSSVAKPAADISHLVRKKRKPEDDIVEESDCKIKRVAAEASSNEKNDEVTGNEIEKPTETSDANASGSTVNDVVMKDVESKEKPAEVAAASE